MKIKNIEIKNFKNIRTAEITFGDLITKVSGKNWAGKSTIYDAIWTALLGKAYVWKWTSAEKLITTGEVQSEIKVKLEATDKTIVIRRKINEKGDMYLEAVDSEANKLLQKDIDALCSIYAVDPLEFTRLSPKDQYQLVQKATWLNTSEIDQEYQIAFDTRAGANSVYKSLKTQLEAMWDVRMVERVNTQELSNDLQAINAHNKQWDDIETRINNWNIHVQRLDQDISDLEKQLKEIMDKIDKKNADKIEANKIIDDLKIELIKFEKKDAQPILDKLAAADSINMSAEKRSEYARLQQQVQVAETKAIQLDTQVKEISDRKKKMIASANMPLDNMEINEKDWVIVDWLPFSQYSTAQQIMMACKIATATNPEIKLIGIKDWSLLDEDTMEKLEKFADECGYQFYLERVGEEVDWLIIRDWEVQPVYLDK